MPTPTASVRAKLDAMLESQRTRPAPAAPLPNGQAPPPAEHPAALHPYCPTCGVPRDWRTGKCHACDPPDRGTPLAAAAPPDGDAWADWGVFS